MLRKFQAQLAKLDLAGKKVLVAVSTGCDSMVLLDLLLKSQRRFDLQIYVAYVDHQLRPASKVETAFIKDYCHEKQLPLRTYTWPLGEHPAKGVEAAARKVRYDFFKRVMVTEQLTTLLTAHHADDQAETFLMKLIRGGQLAQLTAIAPQRDFGAGKELVRPLLGFTKQELADYAQANNLTYFEDETNASDDYQRNRIRHHLLPLLKAENPQVLDHIAAYRTQLSDLLALGDELAATNIAKMKAADGSYNLKVFQTYSSKLQVLCLQHLLMEQGVELRTQLPEELRTGLLDDRKPNLKIKLNKGYYLLKSYERFSIESASLKNQARAVSYNLEPNEWIDLGAAGKVGLVSFEDYQVRSGDDCLELSELPAGGLVLRHRLSGDKLLTKHGRQKVKKIMIDNKVPLAQRKTSWLVADQGQNVYWVLGLKKSDLSRGAVNAKIQYIVVHRS